MWRWKVYDHQPHEQMSLLEAMDAGSKGGSDIPSSFIPGASPWMISDVILMKTCGLTLKIAEIRYSNFMFFLLLFFCSECSCVFHGYFVHCKQYCKTFSVLSNRVSTVPPVVNSKGIKTDLLFTGMIMNVTVLYMWTYSSQPRNLV